MPENSRQTGNSFDSADVEIVATGLASIDAVHVTIESLYGDWVGCIASGDLRGFRRGFLDLVELMRQHFRAEEQVMDGLLYPRRFHHLADHKRFLEGTGDLEWSIAHRFDTSDCEAVAKFVKYWMVRHADGEDRQLAEFVRGATARIP